MTKKETQKRILDHTFIIQSQQVDVARDFYKGNIEIGKAVCKIIGLQDQTKTKSSVYLSIKLLSIWCRTKWPFI